MRAKALFEELGAAYEEFNVLDHGEEHEVLANKYNWRTVPMIFIGDEFVGGFDDVQKLHHSGELTQKLNA